MRTCQVKIFLFIFFLECCGSVYSQDSNFDGGSSAKKADDSYILIGTAVVLLVSPTFIIEDKKFYFGLSRELCLGFGKEGEFRISAEYTFIFRSNLKHHFRAALKYDILSELNRGAWLDTRSYVSIGAGYFLDAGGIGFSPELSAGIRIGADEGFNLYPYIKLRHTFMLKKEKPDNSDFSLGIAFGFHPL